MKKSLLKKISSFLGLLLVLSSAAFAREVRYTSRNLRDPFQSPFEIFSMDKGPSEEPVVEYGLAHLRVQGMVWGTEMPQAIINNAVLRVGEVIDGAEILDIRKEGVYVSYQGQQYILRPIIK